LSDKELLDESDVKPTSSRHRFRLSVRLVCLIGAVLFLLPLGGKDILLPLVPALSSFVAIASTLASKTIRPILGLGLVTGLVVLVQYRWFCRWVCPMGVCLDGASFLGRRLNRKPPQAMWVGQWLLTLTLGGAIVGYPLFLWCDPLALFAGLFLLTERYNQFTGILSFLLAMLLLIFSVLWPHVWCRSLCPLGAFQDLLFRWFRFTHATVMSVTDVRGRSHSAHPVARRTVLGLLVGAASASILRLTNRKSLQPVRPPGAVSEGIFKGLCTRCGNCIRSCPYEIIHRDTGSHNFVNILTPIMTFDEDYCREDCIRCTRVCPSGALIGVDLVNKSDVYIGLAQVDMNLCLLSEDRECSACMRWCPYNAIRYVFSEAEYTLVPVIDPSKCNGCGACETACPTSPHKAIKVFSDSKMSGR
jgi:MauM/NapG family ferredoxin protein